MDKHTDCRDDEVLHRQHLVQRVPGQSHTKGNGSENQHGVHGNANSSDADGDGPVGVLLSIRQETMLQVVEMARV